MDPLGAPSFCVSFCLASLLVEGEAGFEGTRRLLV